MSDQIDERFSDPVRLLRRTLEKHGKILVMGVGKSENIANKIVATFNSTGAPSVVLNCQNALHGDLSIVMDGDVVIALSYSGETNELLELLPHLKRRSASIIALTAGTIPPSPWCCSRRAAFRPRTSPSSIRPAPWADAC
ncbi:MAG: hypothetical protein CMO80_16550 [Verrucomicrobiales bacterium]|nr:hypothetical protein [Verrucomicrobiales bacterium]|tara:strand:+ start:9147 stop:9566 length:420 start_codon:yes stop_codon:yes gene_type:complete